MIKINNGIEELTRGYRNCNTSQISIFDGYAKVRESLYARVINWVNIILNRINTKVILPRYEKILHDT
jgi:hypothetical protein